MKQHVAQIIRERATIMPNREVFRFISNDCKFAKPYTWSEFLDEVTKISQVLVKYDLGFSDNIGIFSDNRPQWTIADLAILSIRGVVVPVYATSSASQLKYIANETQMKLIFVGNQEQLDKSVNLMNESNTLQYIVILNSTIKSNHPNCISWNDFLATETSEGDKQKAEQLLSEASIDDLATIIYTSGTTGEPKGAMLTHSNFVNCFIIHDIRLVVTEDDISLCFLPLSHVFERSWTYYILYRGATNVYLENPKTVIQALPKAKPTLMCTVPRFFEKTYEGIQLEVNVPHA